MDTKGHGAIAGGRRIFVTINLAIAMILFFSVFSAKLALLSLMYIGLIFATCQCLAMRFPECNLYRQYKRGARALLKINNKRKRLAC